jgi:formylmethanofuran dehydrogenase subunit B
VKSSNNTTSDALLDEGHDKPIVCGGCELLCEDLTTQSIESGTRCALADNWFAHGELRPESMIDGKNAPLTKAIDMAAQRLLSSRRPLITGLVSTTIDTIQIACTLAERIHAAIDANASETSILTAPTAIRVGDVTADFEELRDRADLAIFWGCDPIADSPRFIERFIQPVPHNGVRRTISIGPTPVLPPSSHDLHFPVAGNQLVSLARIVQAQVEQKATNRPSGALESIADQLKKSIDAAHCIGLISTITEQTGLVSWSLSHLIRSLAHQKPCFGIRLNAGTTAGGGNCAGASTVCTWRFGSPGAIPYASIKGSAFFPAEADVQRLIERNEVDCMLIIGRMPSRIKDFLTTSTNPKTVIHVSDTFPLSQHKNSIQLGCASLSHSTEGGMLRSDGRLISLQPFATSQQPSIQKVLNGLLDQVTVETRRRSTP